MAWRSPHPRASGLVEALRADLPLVLREVEQVLAEGWPDYAGFLAVNRDEVDAAGRLALEQLVQVAEHARDSGVPLGIELTVFEEIGRAQWRAGRPLPTLLSAYQAGARVAWRRFARSAALLGLPAEEVALLAEAVFAFVDGLCSASARGYVEEQSGGAEERQRCRSELVELLLSDRSGTEEVAAAAARAGWPLPDRVSVLLVPDDDPLSAEALARLGPECLPLRRPGLVGALLPHTSHGPAAGRLDEVLPGTHAVVGPPVPLRRLPAALTLTAVAQRLHREGVLPGDPVLVAEHLDAIIVHRDAQLLEVLRAQVLAPLATLPPDAHERLEETLGAWLRHMGNQQAVAAELHVHRQTVRYRLAQLREVFGTDLDDVAYRQRLTLALAWGGPEPGADPPVLPQPRRERPGHPG